MKQIITLFFVAFIGLFVLTGCVSTDPQALKIEVDSLFGEADDQVEIFAPHDMTGKMMLVEVGRVDNNLPDNVATVAEAGALGPPQSAKAGEHSPVLNKEHLGLTFMLMDYENVNNPAVIEAVANLKKAVSENNTEAIKSGMSALTEALKLVNPAP